MPLSVPEADYSELQSLSPQAGEALGLGALQDTNEDFEGVDIDHYGNLYTREAEAEGPIHRYGKKLSRSPRNSTEQP